MVANSYSFFTRYKNSLFSFFLRPEFYDTDLTAKLLYTEPIATETGKKSASLSLSLSLSLTLQAFFSEAMSCTPPPRPPPPALEAGQAG